MRDADRKSLWRRLNEYGPGYERLFPELTRYEDPQALRDAIYHAHMRIMESWAFRLFFLFAVVSGMAIGVLQGLLADRLLAPLGVSTLMSLPLVFLVACTLGIGGYLFTFHRPMQTAFRQRLNHDGLPTCMGCGYNLQAATADRCPECGTERAKPESAE